MVSVCSRRDCVANMADGRGRYTIGTGSVDAGRINVQKERVGEKAES